jgi:competence protein ComEC
MPLIPVDLHLPSGAVSGTGTVVSFPEAGSGRQRAVVDLDSDRYHGKALLYTDPYPALEPGQVLSLKGRLQEPSNLDGFDYKSYLAKDGIHAVTYRPKIEIVNRTSSPTSWLYPVRRGFLEHLGRVFSEPAAGFLAAILIGDRTGIPDDVVDAFRATGTIHVMALSGYNISILVAALIAIIGRGRFAVWMVFAGIIGFVILVGPSASVVRAAVMGGLLLLSQVLGRPQAAVRICLIAAAIMLTLQPWALRYDLGFDLSFLATLGILLLEPGVTVRLQRLPEMMRDIISPTIAASIPTMPLIASSFGTVSLVSPAANLLVVPVIPWLMLGGFIAGLASFLSETVAAVIAVPIQLITDATLGLVQYLGEFSFASIGLGTWRNWFVVGSGLACMLALWLLRRPIRA